MPNIAKSVRINNMKAATFIKSGIDWINASTCFLRPKSFREMYFLLTRDGIKTFKRSKHSEQPQTF